MKKKLFVSNLEFQVEAEELRELFEEVGGVVSVVIARDRETKKSKGFAFIEMDSEDNTKKAIDTLNNRELKSRPIKVAFDRGKGAGGPGASTASGGAEGGKRKFEPLPPIQRTHLFRRRKKTNPFLEDPNKKLDYRDVATLSRYVSERGKILSRRHTGLDAFHQRKLTRAIKRAQSLGLMPYRYM